MDGLLWFLLIGLAAGWLAGQLMKKRSMGLIGIGIIWSIRMPICSARNDHPGPNR